MKNKLYICFVFFYFLFHSLPVYSIDGSKELEDRLKKLEAAMVEMQQSYQGQIAELQNEIHQLKASKSATDVSNEGSDAGELQELRKMAQTEIDEGRSSGSGNHEKREFCAGNLSLQAENPEISVTGDFVYSLRSMDGNRNNADATFRSLGLHYETYLDPYTKFKGAVPVLENDSMLGEAYITRYGVTDSLNITLGKFRQQFGVINRWHKHGLDFVDFPMSMRRIFGDGGLNQNGISFDWNLGSSGRENQELTLQLTEATNARLFSGNTKGAPSLLAHFKSFRDIDADRYREVGFTAMAGVNDEWKFSNAGVVLQKDMSRPVYLLGLDYTYLWEPADNMRYRNFLWRSEFYGMRKEIFRPDGAGKDSINCWGAYTNLQWKLNRELESGVLLDYYHPDSKDYASIAGLSLAPLAYNQNDPEEWQIAPYITWHQSPWVRYRLEFNYRSGNNIGPDERKVLFQCIWAAGPHKHDRY